MRHARSSGGKSNVDVRRPAAHGKRGGAAPRVTLPRALRSQLARLLRSPLRTAHLACGVVGGVACGAYFSTSAWDPLMGADAFAQFLGALMPLMSGIACGLSVDKERAAGRLANLTALPSRPVAALALWASLFLMGTAALALALGIFGAFLTAAGRLAAGPAPLLLAWAGSSLGSLPLYALALALALRLGRNVAIGVGAAGTLVAFFSVGGLAHGLMTGELTGAASSALGWLPLSWAARLGSLGVESVIAAGRGAAGAASVGKATLGTAGACMALSVAAVCALVAWFCRFEEGRHDA